MSLFDITVTVEAASAAEAAGKVIYDTTGQPVTDFKAIQVMPQLRMTPKFASGGIISGDPVIGGSSIVGRA